MDFILNLLIFVSISGILAVSLNYITGFSGVISIAHGGFYGIGAYTVALLTKSHGFNFIVASLVGFVIAGVVAYLLSYPVLRLKGDSQMLVTFGFAIIIFNLLLNLQDLTNGPLGVKGIPAPELFGVSFFSKANLLILCLVFLVITFLFFWKIINSPYGTVLKGVRENPLVMESLGFNSKGYQRSAFIVGSSFAAIAGGLFAVHISFIEPGSFDLMASVWALIMIILGGLGSMWGGLLGAAITMLIPDMLRFLGLPSSIMAETQQIIYGLILLGFMYYRPQGIIGKYKL